jgi:succinoglycan biosynthesis protein ExoV
MKLFVYKGAVPNFGDELNEWLIPQVFPDLFDDDQDEMLLAIGSILYNNHPTHVKKIVFGSGYGGYTAIPKLDARWDVRCVRGPLTAEALGLPKTKVAGDSGILIRDHYRCAAPKRWPISFIPHFQSIARGHWQAACAMTKIHFIDPRSPVDEVLRQISESEVVVTEAMHGAIIADALRTPWIAMKPTDPMHHMKWRDWAGALNLDIRFQTVHPTSVKEWLTLREQKSGRILEAATRFRVTKFLDAALLFRASRSLTAASRAEPQLSSDHALERATDLLRNEAAALARDYSRRR